LTKRADTGHIMLIAAAPQRMPSEQPIVPGTEQWRIRIIDCSMSGHGLSDTRHGKGTNGKDHNGLGEGICRIYIYSSTANAGQIAGWSWSMRAVSKFLAPQDEDLLIGRLKPDFHP